MNLSRLFISLKYLGAFLMGALRAIPSLIRGRR